MAALARLIGHGGVYGAVAEAALAVVVGGFFVWIWLRERRAARSGERSAAEMRDE